MKKFLAPLMLSGLLVVVLAAPGGASAPSGSVIDGCAFTVTGDVSPGATVSISGTGFQEDAELPISVNNVVVGVTPPILNGGILPPTNVEIPGDATEPITIVIPCGAGPNSGVASQTFGAAALAFTGSDSTNTWIAVGLAAIVVGGVLVFGARRRSQLRSRQLHV